MFTSLFTNLESNGLFNKFNIFCCSIVYIISVAINEFKEKFSIVFCCFSVIKNIAASLFPKFSVKLIY